MLVGIFPDSPRIDRTIETTARMPPTITNNALIIFLLNNAICSIISYCLSFCYGLRKLSHRHVVDSATKKAPQ